MHHDKHPRREPGLKHSKRKANAIGFAKRQARKVKVSSGSANPTDVYEYQAEKNKRANVSLSLAKDEKLAFNVDDEDEEGDVSERMRGMRRPRLIGEISDDDVIPSDDDEDIDSDNAFEEGDDERFAGFGFSKKKGTSQQRASRNHTSRPSKKVRIADVDLNESDEESIDKNEAVSKDAENEEEEEDGYSDEFIDLLDVLDGKGLPFTENDDSEQNSMNIKPSDRISEQTRHDDKITDKKYEEDEEEDSDGGSQSLDAENVDSLAVSDDEDGDANEDSALDQLDNFISKLDTGAKRKINDADAKEPDALPVKKKKRLTERTEGVPENEFGVKASDSTKLSLDDLLQPLASQSSALASLKKSTKVLTSSSEKNKPLAAPLPQRTQERLDREAAYEQTKEEVEKWDETIKRIKEAEHLSFPLQPRSMGNTSNLELVAKFRPTTEFEKSIDKLLKSAKLREEDIASTEELKMNHLSIEEVAERRAELRKMRDLMYRTELKAKRVAKIKSKTYRRIRRKEMEKISGVTANNAGDEENEEARLKRETERARERATLRHKNTGKWAKAMRSRGELDVDQRRDINDMLEQGERLRRKIHGEASEDELQSDSDESEVGEVGLSKIKADAFEELSQLQDGDLELDSSNPNQKPGRSIFDMKFMKAATERQQREVNQIIDDFEKEIGVIPGDGASDNEEMERDEALDDHTVDRSDLNIRRTGGRVVYHPGSQLHARENVSQVSQISDDASTLKSSEPYLPSSVEVPERQETSTSLSNSGPSMVPLSEPNPWLRSDISSSKVARKKNEMIVSKDSNSATKSGYMLDKRKQKTVESRTKALDDATLEISSDAVLIIKNDSGKKKPKKARSTKKSTTTPGDNESDGSEINSELEDQESTLARGGKVLQQRDLVARAFALDHVVQEFEDAKRQEVASDAPKEVDTTLPGWGAWGGTGTKPTPARPHLIKKIPGIDPSSRADYKKAHVIISEKKDKKASKYMVKDLPYPYTSKAQFEKSMDTPLGTEWNTRVGFQRGTLPKVVKKMGTVIDPVQRLF